MIFIKNLTKKYRSKNKRTCTALNSINLTLPDSGMIFVIGKSGSGKSTLLNLIGGLDSFEGGTIIADGNNLSKFRASDFYKYRASYASFIFQDYHLIEELTIKENVKLSLEIEGEKDIDVSPALASVDLAGYEDRFPDELSGGQKQRVAIARAIVKSPRVILCDEPTGNLDKNTSTQILDLLKEISKDRLVLIVSHNMPDAEKYGDRIIELADGIIISDKTRKAGYKNEFSLTNGTLTLPYNHNLTDEEINFINEEAGKGTIKKYRQNDGGYEATTSLEGETSKVRMKPSKMNAKTKAKLFSAFTKRGFIRSATTAFLSAVMLVLLIIFQSFLSFDGGKVISNSLAEQGTSTLVLKKNTYYDEYGNVNKTYLYGITDEDVEKIDEISGENTKKYFLYSYTLNTNDADPTRNFESEKEGTYTFIHNNIYVDQMAGTLVCDEEYLINKFGVDGQLKVIAGDINASKDSAGIIITDYQAECMMVYNPTKYRRYEDIIGKISLSREFVYGSVAAIIDTGYKTTYADAIAKIAENKYQGIVGFDTLDEAEAIRLIDDIKTNLNIGYSLNPDFTTAILDNDVRGFTSLGASEISSPDSDVSMSFVYGAVVPNEKLGKGEIILPDNVVNQIFPFETPSLPFTVQIKKYQYPEGAGDVIIDEEYTVVGIQKTYVQGFGSYIYMNESDFLELKKKDVVPYAVYLESYNNADVLINEMAKNYFSWYSTNGTAVTLLNQSVSMFYDLFSLFEILLVLLIVVFLTSYSIRSIQSNYYQIGVIKAIGGRSGDISAIYTAQTALLTIFVCILTYLGAFFLVDVANDILIESFTRITNAGIESIDIISFDIGIVTAVISLTFVLSIASTIAPLLALRRIKPISIIKAKE